MNAQILVFVAALACQAYAGPLDFFGSFIDAGRGIAEDVARIPIQAASSFMGGLRPQYGFGYQSQNGDDYDYFGSIMRPIQGIYGQGQQYAQQIAAQVGRPFEEQLKQTQNMIAQLNAQLQQQAQQLAAQTEAGYQAGLQQGQQMVEQAKEQLEAQVAQGEQAVADATHQAQAQFEGAASHVQDAASHIQDAASHMQDSASEVAAHLDSNVQAASATQPELQAPPVPQLLPAPIEH